MFGDELVLNQIEVVKGAPWIDDKGNFLSYIYMVLGQICRNNGRRLKKFVLITILCVIMTMSLSSLFSLHTHIH